LKASRRLERTSGNKFDASELRHRLTKSPPVSWKALHDQFGGGFSAHPEIPGAGS
jgi:hypothetical protein